MVSHHENNYGIDSDTLVLYTFHYQNRTHRSLVFDTACLVNCSFIHNSRTNAIENGRLFWSQRKCESRIYTYPGDITLTARLVNQILNIRTKREVKFYAKMRIYNVKIVLPPD